MDIGKPPAPAPRLDREQLRAIAESDLWEEVGEPGRAALTRLLEDESLTGRFLDRELRRIRYSHRDLAEVINKWQLRRGAAERHVPLPAPDRTTGRPEAAADDTAVGARHLNLSLTWPLSRRVVPETCRLGAGQRYEIRVDIGALSGDSLLRGQGPFPEEVLEHTDDGGDGDWLYVTVVSEDFLVAPERHALFLPLTGRSWVCPCPPAGRHSCREDHRDDHLRIPVTAPDEPGPARFRMLVSYRGNQLQSASVTAEVAPREDLAGGGIRGWIDYTLTGGFDQLTPLPSRTAAIRVSRGVGDAVTVDVDGWNQPVSTLWLTEGQVEGALARMRAALTDVHVKYEQRLDRLTGEEFLGHLWSLAGAGWALLHLLAPARTQRAALRKSLRQPSDIQICRQEGTPLLFPWALVYDIPIDRGAGPQMCEAGIRQALRGEQAARECPAEPEHEVNSVCPYGFWGYRHSIEQPASRRRRQRLELLAGRGGDSLTVTVGRSRRLDEVMANRHLNALRDRFGRNGLIDCADRTAFKKALAGGSQDCVYLYCHGHRSPDAADSTAVTKLEIGYEALLHPEDVSAWAEAVHEWEGWEESKPLIFLNGCHTADDTPATWLSFVDAFCDLSASGVVGTEISVTQRFASEVAERFWAYFVAGDTVGTALHRVRTDLLHKRNLLGLAYTAYCSADLRLRTG